MSGFRGSRVGPVMNGLASVQTGLMHSIHFNRHGDNPLSITESLFYHINVGGHTSLKNKIDLLVMLDRGYNYASVQQYLTKFGMRFLGTHSEKFDNWPFTTTVKNNVTKRFVDINGARSVYTAQKKPMMSINTPSAIGTEES
jgi:hypothetical protein